MSKGGFAAKSRYSITLTPEALELLEEYRISSLMDEDGVFECSTFTQEGSFLHLTPIFPESKVLFAETAPKSLFEKPIVEIMLPMHFVLYISSFLENKTLGFSGKRQDSDKNGKANH